MSHYKKIGYNINVLQQTYLLMRRWGPDALAVCRAHWGLPDWISFALVFSFIYC